MTENKLKEKIDLLDQEPTTSWSKEDLWETVELKLDSDKRKTSFSMIYRLAASIVMGLSAWWWFSQTDEIVVREELVNDYVEAEEFFSGEDVLSAGKLFIEEACQKQLDVCETPDFEELYAELVLVEEEKTALEQIINQYGEDEASTKALIQLENTESSLTSELINIILS